MIAMSCRIFALPGSGVAELDMSSGQSHVLRERVIVATGMCPGCLVDVAPARTGRAINITIGSILICQQHGSMTR